MPLHARDQLPLHAVALRRHGRRAAEDDDVALLVREVARGRLVALVDAVELLGVEPLEVEGRGHHDDAGRGGLVVLVHQHVAARRVHDPHARAPGPPGRSAHLMSSVVFQNAESLSKLDMRSSVT